MSIESDAQQPSVGQIVELFTLDLTPIDATADILYFTANVVDASTAVVWDGQTYAPAPVEVTGFEWKGDGSLPRPVAKISNITSQNTGVTAFPSVTSLLIQYHDCVGARVTRTRTLRKHLDDGDDPDTNQTFGPTEIWVVRRKRLANRLEVHFELGALIDVQGRQIPGRVALRNSCPWRYRVYDASIADFNYDNVIGCPYTGDNWYTISGDETRDPSLDVCGKRLNDCVRRFGTDVPLPYGAFPAIGKIH